MPLWALLGVLLERSRGFFGALAAQLTTRTILKITIFLTHSIYRSQFSRYFAIFGRVCECEEIWENIIFHFFLFAVGSDLYLGAANPCLPPCSW